VDQPVPDWLAVLTIVLCLGGSAAEWLERELAIGERLYPRP
jgi:hypothetical protein